MSSFEKKNVKLHENKRDRNFLEFRRCKPFLLSVLNFIGILDIVVETPFCVWHLILRLKFRIES